MYQMHIIKLVTKSNGQYLYCLDKGKLLGKDFRNEDITLKRIKFININYCPTRLQMKSQPKILGVPGPASSALLELLLYPG